MKRFISVALLAALLAGCAHDSPCVPVYDDQGRLVHTNTCMKGTTQDNWETAGAIAGGAAAISGSDAGYCCPDQVKFVEKARLWARFAFNECSIFSNK